MAALAHRAAPLLLGGMISVLYVGIGLVISRSKVGNAILWCIPLSILLSTSYVYGIQSSRSITYGGIVGDNSFEIASLNNAIHGNYFGDSYERTIPSDYPLLYFSVLGTASRIIGLNAISAWRFAPVILFLLLPFVIYEIGHSLKDPETGIWCCVSFFGLGAMKTELFVEPVRNWGTFTMAIQKPYELLGELILLYCLIRLSCWIALEKLSAMSIVGCIVMGTFLLLDYYPFFFLLLAIVGVYGLLERGHGDTQSDQGVRRRNWIRRHLLGTVLVSIRLRIFHRTT